MEEGKGRELATQPQTLRGREQGKGGLRERKDVYPWQEGGVRLWFERESDTTIIIVIIIVVVIIVISVPAPPPPPLSASHVGTITKTPSRSPLHHTNRFTRLDEFPPFSSCIRDEEREREKNGKEKGKWGGEGRKEELATQPQTKGENRKGGLREKWQGGCETIVREKATPSSSSSSSSSRYRPSCASAFRLPRPVP
jgi:hypothetical protein